MRMMKVLGLAAVLGVLGMPAARGQEAFDACEVFTQSEAEAALGTPAAAEPVNPKVKRPKVVATCTYSGTKDGKALAVSVQFRFGKTEAEAKQAFGDARLQFQTKPVLISGNEAFWSAKTGQMHVRKGRTWLTVSIGSDKPSERDLEQARKLAEVLAKKI